MAVYNGEIDLKIIAENQEQADALADTVAEQIRLATRNFTGPTVARVDVAAVTPRRQAE